MSTSPADTRRQRSQHELLAIAKQLPVPVLPEGRSEEMRTAFLATVRDARSTKRARALAARGRGRLLLVAAMLLAGAGFAAAAWRITRGTPASRPLDTTASAVGRQPHGGESVPEQRSKEGSTLAPPGPALLGQTPPRQAPLRDAPLRSTRRVAVTSPLRAPRRRTSSLRSREGGARCAPMTSRRRPTPSGRRPPSERTTRSPRTPSSGEAWRSIGPTVSPEAQEALTRFLVRYPKSDRVGEAAVMLGWLLLRAGDATAADARFGSALGDPSERVRRSALAGLAASGRHRAP